MYTLSKPINLTIREGNPITSLVDDGRQLLGAVTDTGIPAAKQPKISLAGALYGSLQGRLPLNPVPEHNTTVPIFMRRLIKEHNPAIRVQFDGRRIPGKPDPSL